MATDDDFNPRSHEESGKWRFGTLLRLRDFNPRSHEESGVTLPAISVHNRTFQSTLSRGERRLGYVFFLFIREFQSTLSRGERLSAPMTTITFFTFQSTLSRGERPLTMDLINYAEAISIHALTRRAAKMVVLDDGIAVISIHALTRRAANARLIIVSYWFISIHALTRRAAVSDLQWLHK